MESVTMVKYYSFIQIIRISLHHLSQMLLISDPWRKENRKRFRVHSDTIGKTVFVDGCTRVLGDAERPQEQCRIDEDGPTGEVLARADTSNDKCYDRVVMSNIIPSSESEAGEPEIVANVSVAVQPSLRVEFVRVGIYSWIFGDSPMW